MLTRDQVNILENKLKNMKKDYEERLSGDRNETETPDRWEGIGELSSYDNHPGDQATEVFEREKDTAINNLSRKKLEDIERAFQAIDRGEYGICEICFEPISFERLEIVPETRRCINHADTNGIQDGRPAEEDVTDATPSERRGKEEVIFDKQDAWEAVSDHGSSQSPSDVPLSKKGYADSPSEDTGKSDDVEDKALSDLEGKDTGITFERKEHNDGSRNRYEEKNR